VPRVSRYDWLLFLHVLSAFAVVGAVVIFSVVIAAGWNTDVPSDVERLFRVSRLGDLLVGIGGGGVLVFGIWLAIDVKGYELWDGWIIAAFVLWIAMGAAGSRAGKIYNAARNRARQLAREGDAPSAELQALVRDRTGLRLHILTVLIVFAFIVDMIFKPGA
jgi:uncharacterized membrane protein